MNWSSHEFIWLDWLVLVIGLCGVVAAVWYAIWKDKKAQQGEDSSAYLFGKGEPWYVIGMAIFAANIGSEHLVGLAGTGAKDGDEGNQFGTIFSFRRDYNVTSATYAYSKTRPMNDVPDLRYYVNDETKEFAGWTTEYGDLSKLIDPNTFVPDKDMTLYPAWYDLALIRLNANGGKFRYSYSDDNEGLQKVYVRKGKKFSPYGDYEEPTMDGGVFVGWSETANGSPVAYGKTYTPNSSMNFYAVWEQGYTITLDANLGTQSGSIHYISPSGQEYHGDPTKAVFTIRKGDSVLVDSENSSEQVGGWREDDYILAGFSKTKDGEKVDLKKYIPEKDETFYAIWEATTCWL